jgi:hypothetical protein
VCFQIPSSSFLSLDTKARVTALGLPSAPAGNWVLAKTNVTIPYVFGLASLFTPLSGPVLDVSFVLVDHAAPNRPALDLIAGARFITADRY